MKAPVTPKSPKSSAKLSRGVKGYEKYSTFRLIITLVASGVIVTHLVICSIILLNPSVKIFNSAAVTRTYKIYALPGPYFKEELIKSSPHFYIAGKMNRAWEKWRNPELDNFNTFHNEYWHFDKLKQSDLERHLARKLYKRLIKDGEEDFINYHEFKDLHRYFGTEYFKERPDSIRLLYTKSTYKPRERKTKIDTLFFLKYKPW
jgi:hypothetical protein